MDKPASMHKRHRFPPEIIQHTVWLYHHFDLSTRDIEDLMAERGIAISYESIRLWCIKFGPKYAKRLRRQHQGYGDTFFIDEVFVKIQGKQHYLWRAVDQDGDVVDVFLQRRRDGRAAKRFFKRLLRASGSEPRRIVTDKLRSYSVAHRELIPDTIHDSSQYANNRAEKLICQYHFVGAPIPKRKRPHRNEASRRAAYKQPIFW
jgi:putative transposase